MGSCNCKCSGFSDKLEFPNLQNLSSYGGHQQLPNKNLIQTIALQSSAQYKKNILEQIIRNNNIKQFKDQKFILDPQNSIRLSSLFNYQKNNIKIYSKSINTQLLNFVQLQLQFTYLSTIFYFLFNKQIKKSILESIIQTKTINSSGFYILNFYCNGKNHSIVIDDFIPTNKQAPIYLRMVSGNQIWPFLIEKAWCKQIGSYSKALGLSPEDAFQQITGIPCYSYKLRNNEYINNLILKAYSQGQWIAFVAYDGLQDLNNRQVFYLISIQNQQYTLISCFVPYKFNGYNQKRRGQVRIRVQSLFSHFQFVVIGYYKEGYKNTSIPIKCKSHQQLIFNMTLTKPSQISIRFNQFYAGYIKEDQKQKYRYSPILVEIYKLIQNEDKSEFVLMENGEGCKRSYSGARAIYFTKDVFSKFDAGRYFIRMEVDWAHQSDINEGNLNIYSSQASVLIANIQNDNQFLEQVYPSLINFNLKIKQNKNKFQNTTNQQFNLDIITYFKQKTTLIMFKNLHQMRQQFQINFQKSTNIIIRGGKVTGKKTILTINGQSQKVIQILPEKIKQESVIQDYQITKIDQKIIK